MIIKNDLDALRKIAEPAGPDEVAEIISLLEKELIASAEAGQPGVGLAAPQIGINKRVAIVRSSEFSLDLVNTQFVKCEDPFLFGGEGCLSFPGKVSNTQRWRRITIKNFVGMSEECEMSLSDLNSVIVQHEAGHWDGKIFTDYEWIPSQKIGRNDPCKCGSGKKFKKCCL